MTAEHSSTDRLCGERPSLSLCMIVRNEESLLPKCLESVKDCVDEIVVVDTGSTDKTVEIAIEHGAKVHHHPWEGDFSKHQNQSVDFATGDWLLQMDADEELARGSCRIIKEAIKDPRADALSVNILSYFNKGASCSRESKIRIFRNRPDIRFESIVHKQLRGYKCQKAIPATIYHYGYDLSPEEQKKKFERTFSLLNRQIADDPENYWHRHNLAACYSSNFMFQEAVEEGIRALSLAEKQGLHSSNVLWTHYTVAASYMKLGNLVGAKDLALKAIRRSADHLDSHFVLVLACHQQKRWKDLEYHAKEFFRIVDLMKLSPERFTGSIIYMANEGWRVRLALGDLHLEKNEEAKARAEFETALSITPVPWECLKIIADCYKNRRLWEKSAHYYQQAIKERNDYLEAILGLAFTSRRLGRTEEAIHFYNRARELKHDSVEALVQLGEIYHEQGEPALAQTFYEQALVLEPNLVNISLHLARLHLSSGDLECCVYCCDHILRVLELPGKKRLDSLSDLANLFMAIAHEMDQYGKEELFKEAVEIAVSLNPKLLSS